jgi:hypothetical protein
MRWHCAPSFLRDLLEARDVAMYVLRERERAESERRLAGTETYFVPRTSTPKRHEARPVAHDGTE